MNAHPTSVPLSRGVAVALAALLGLAAAAPAHAASVASIQRGLDEANGTRLPRATVDTSGGASAVPVVDENACTHTFLAHRYRGC